MKKILLSLPLLLLSLSAHTDEYKTGWDSFTLQLAIESCIISIKSSTSAEYLQTNNISSSTDTEALEQEADAIIKASRPICNCLIKNVAKHWNATEQLTAAKEIESFSEELMRNGSCTPTNN